MSISKDPAKPTTKDLSDTPEAQSFPSYFSSMAGGNMVTEKNPHFAGQGTDSEASHDVVAGDVDWVGSQQHVPVLPGDKTPAGELDTDEKGSGYTPSARTWKEC
jgi:hypothetical protein